MLNRKLLGNIFCYLGFSIMPVGVHLRDIFCIGTLGPTKDQCNTAKGPRGVSHNPMTILKDTAFQIKKKHSWKLSLNYYRTSIPFPGQPCIHSYLHTFNSINQLSVIDTRASDVVMLFYKHCRLNHLRV